MMIACLEKITPEIAAAMLEGNNENRRPSRNVVAQLASDMRSGNWKKTGQPIIIAEDGQLNDGQHRLLAVVQSGITVEMMVVRGASRESRDAIDTGRPRGAGDILQMFHIPDGHHVAALALIVMSYERSGRKRLGDKNVVSKADVIIRSQTDKRLLMAAKVGWTLRHLMTRKQGAFGRYVIPDGPVSDEFFARLSDGVSLAPGHPALSLRQWFMRLGRKAPDAQAIEALLRAWSAFRDGRDLSRIQIMGEFPTP
jgi:hypothetical protein